jgi:hypothetical protein
MGEQRNELPKIDIERPCAQKISNAIARKCKLSKKKGAPGALEALNPERKKRKSVSLLPPEDDHFII